MNKSVFFIGIIFCLAVSSCIKKDPEIKPEPAASTSSPSSVTFRFLAKIKSDTLVPGTKMYTNASQDSFTVTKFNYYISNVTLIREDGYVFAEPKSYHLMRHTDGKTSFSVDSLPTGNYTKIEFLIGVDSLGNESGAGAGDLDVKNDMYWNWLGFLFLKLEGVFNTVERPERGEYAIHIGGYTGPYPCLQKCAFDLAAPVVAKDGNKPVIFYNVQIDELFEKPQHIGFDYYYANISDKLFKDISDNYKDMFVIDKIEN